MVLLRRYGPVLLPWTIFLSLTWPTVDFGHHWDEDFFQIRPVRHAVERGLPMPGIYNYPGLGYWLNGACLTPALWADSDRGLRERLLAEVDSPDYSLRIRRIRVAATALVVVWVYLVLLELRRTVWEALLASFLVALSWEVIYHSRWPANDTLVMQFGMLAALAAVYAAGRTESRAVLWSAAFGGLACGAKYPGGLALLPALYVTLARGFQVVVQSHGSWTAASWADRLRALRRPWVMTLGAFTGFYLLTTPGTFLEFRLFRLGIRDMMRQYWGGFQNFTIERGPEHFLELLRYLGTEGLSTAKLPATLAALLAVGGLIHLWRQDRHRAATLFILPVTYGAYFCTQRVMIVRNYMLLFPFLAVATALACGALARRGKFPRALIAVAAVGLIGYNLSWQIQAAETIRDRRESLDFNAELLAYLEKQPQRFALSDGVREVLGARADLNAADLTADLRNAGNADLAICLLSELGERFPANRPELFETWLGPREVNLMRYPAWAGQDRPVVLRYDVLKNVPAESQGLCQTSPAVGSRAGE